MGEEGPAQRLHLPLNLQGCPQAHRTSHQVTPASLSTLGNALFLALVPVEALGPTHHCAGSWSDPLFKGPPNPPPLGAHGIPSPRCLLGPLGSLCTMCVSGLLGQTAKI